MADSDKDKGSLADQLAGLSISVKKEPVPSEAPEPEPPKPPSDAEVFAREMEGLSDDELDAAMSRKAPKIKDKGTLGEAIQDALGDVQRVSSKLRKPVAPEAPAQSSGSAGSGSGSRTAAQRDKPMSDEELFADAVDQLSPQDLYRGKYFGSSDVPQPAEGPSLADYTEDGAGAEAGVATAHEHEVLDEGEAREQLKDLQNKRMMEQALGGVDKKVNSSKYRTKQPKVRPYSSEPNEELNTEPIPKSGPGLTDVELQPAQAELMKRFAKRRREHQIPELNLRGDTLDDALRRLELFSHECWKNESGFMRIIHGKGNQSEGDPVLKPAVLRWLEGPGFRYVRGVAPEVKRAGNYGALVVELARL